MPRKPRYLTPGEVLDIIFEAVDYADRLMEDHVRLAELDSHIVRCRCGRPCWEQPCHEVQHCVWCGRPMRLPGWDRLGSKEDVAYGGKGYCMTHYMTVNKYGEDQLEAELNEAVEAYWENRKYVLAGIEVPVDRT